MLKLEQKDQLILLEALEDMMFKISLRLESFKGKPNTKERQELAQKQNRIEALQHSISVIKT